MLYKEVIFKISDLSLLLRFSLLLQRACSSDTPLFIQFTHFVTNSLLPLSVYLIPLTISSISVCPSESVTFAIYYQFFVLSISRRLYLSLYLTFLSHYFLSLCLSLPLCLSPLSLSYSCNYPSPQFPLYFLFF